MTHPFWEMLHELSKLLWLIMKVAVKVAFLIAWSVLVVVLVVWASSDLEFRWPW
jgi:hypothetical protein